MRLSRHPGERWLRFAGRIANAFGVVLLLVVATYVLASLIAYKGWSGVVIAAVASASATLALVSAKARPSLVRAGVAGAACTVVLAAVSAATGGSAPLASSALLLVVLLLVAVAEVLKTVVGEQEVGFRTILGAISVYVILGLLFTFLYAAIDRLQTGQFFGTETQTGDFVFFSITTLTTTGYGNLVPAAQPGKMISGLEMLLGQIFLVTLIAGLVSLWRPGSWRAGDGKS
jgi:multidrug transporter EmrE-like cation transporter